MTKLEELYKRKEILERIIRVLKSNKNMNILEKIKNLLDLTNLSQEDRVELENQRNLWLDIEGRERKSRITFDNAKVARANITAEVNSIYIKYF